MDIKSPISTPLLKEMLARTAFSEEEVRSRLQMAIDPAYWQKLNPGLSVSTGAGGVASGEIEGVPWDPEHRRDLQKSFEKHGYLQARPLLAEGFLSRLRTGVEKLREAGWLPVFAFAYDEFWQLIRPPSLLQLLTEMLGPAFRQDARLWCFYVVPVSGSAGWSPHMDGFGRPGRVVIWIPLTDATLENGCIYLVPPNLMPETVGDFNALKSVSAKDLKTLLHRARALPTAAGTVLAWTCGTIHWGSTCGRPTHPRISVSVEFLARDAEAVADEVPLLEVGLALPPFFQRLEMIAKGILDYQPAEADLFRYRELAQRLLAAAWELQ